MTTRNEYELLGRFAAKVGAIGNKLRNEEIPWADLEPWLQAAYMGKFDRLPSGHPLPLTPFTPPEFQWYQMRMRAEGDPTWGRFSRGDLIRVAPKSDWQREKRGQLVQWVLMAYFDDPIETTKVWWGLIEQMAYWVHADFDYKHQLEIDADHLRLGPGVDFPRNTIRWEKINFGANWVTGYDPEWNYDSVKSATSWMQNGKPSSFIHAQALAAAVHSPAWLFSLDGRILPKCHLPGYQVRSPELGSDWDHSLCLYAEQTNAKVYLKAENTAETYPGDTLVPEILEVADCTSEN
jgi:hypothetical protein